MKKFLTGLIAAVCCLAFASPVFADAVYPYTNPTYIPSAISPPQAFSAPGDYQVTLQNDSLIGVEINGTCTSLAAVVQVSVDGTTWRTVNVYPVVTGTITAAASISAAGMYRANVGGGRAARVHITALTATCNVGAVMTDGGMIPTY